MSVRKRAGVCAKSLALVEHHKLTDMREEVEALSRELEHNDQSRTWAAGSTKIPTIIMPKSDFALF
jgi:hypothetical protein